MMTLYKPAGLTVEIIDRASSPPPTPPPAPAVGSSPIRLQPLTPTGSEVDILAFWRYCSNERYDRMRSLVTLPATGGSLRMIAVKHGSGAPLAVGAVIVNVTATPVLEDRTLGTPIAFAPFTPSATASTFNVPCPTLPGGKWYRLTATAGAWQVPAWYAYVPGGALPTVMPVVRANWELLHSGFVAADAIVPAVFNPLTQPYPARVFEPTTAIPSRATCVETQMVLARGSDLYRPAVASTNAREPEGGASSPRPAGVAGLVTSFNRQPYFYSDLIGNVNKLLPLLDGPRGKGTVFAPQHLQVGRNGKVLFTDNWRFGRIDPDGTVKTMVGYHVPVNSMPTLWTDEPRNYVLAGDWSAVTGPLGLNECWGVATDLRTVAIDPLAAPVNGEQPHIGLGPVMYLPDRLNNRILKVQFNGGGDAALALFGNRDRDAPAKVSVWKSVAEPWDCVMSGNLLIVSERAAQRIAIYNVDTGAEFAAWPMPVATPFPEGLYLQDGVLIYCCVQTGTSGSLTAGAIRKRDIATGTDTQFVALTTPWIIDNNSRFAKIALSDGTFGPRGMLALTTWSGNGYGYPLLFKPDGIKVSDSLFPGQANSGPGLPWKIGSSYVTAAAFGQGRMLVGTMQEGVRVISKAQATDANLATPAYLAGRSEWIARAFNLTNGDDGFPFNSDEPQRWGVSSDIDAYLTAHGHTRN